MLDAAPSHAARLDDGPEVKLGVFLSNTKSRHAKPIADKIQALAALGRMTSSPGEVPVAQPMVHR
ncbi:hypothetical protein [Streptomyces mirabilis]|uniref:hypothetical protein n=1 Tax=Streptomyces mirabilis TaxID=68239 RepID=UPI0036768D8C